jgi:hypothetical protein
MKRYLSLAIAIMALVAVTASAAQAQSSSWNRMQAHIPFAFHVGNKELPAGDYSVAVLNPSSDRKVLQIRRVDGLGTAIIQTLDRRAHGVDEPRLVFRRYGAAYFFAEAQVVGEPTTLTAVKSHAERAEAAAAMRPATKSVVALVAGVSPDNH